MDAEYEQHHRLLSDTSDSESETADVEKSNPPELRNSNTRIAIVTSIICLSIILVIQGLNIWDRSISASAPLSSSHDEIFSPPNYLLSKNWNFNEAPTRREYHWTISDVEFNPDGVYRPMMVINNQFPGPLIEVNEGDTIVVHINNKATNATSIHWHGLYQNGTNYMDGTVGITQCPIAPGTKFTYEFKVSGQYGTYWYHAHQGLQASDGLLGPLVIHSKEEFEYEHMEYDTDQIVMLSDHYHNLTGQLLITYLASDSENAEPVPNGALINGRGLVDCSKYSRKCDNTSAHVGHPSINLESNKNHRLRFINVGAFAEFQVAIDEHQFAIIEVDGTAVVPKYYDRFTINAAQRYSIVINSKDQSKSSFWLRAKMLSACFTDPPKDLKSEIWAIITYGEDNQGLPQSQEWDQSVELVCRDMNTTELHPAKAVKAPEKPDATFYLRANFEIGNWRLSRGVFNQSSWRADVQNPSLLRLIDGIKTQNSSFMPASFDNQQAYVNDVAFDIKRELVVQTSGIQVIDIIITNFDDGNHPLHLHGYKYFVLGQGHGYPPADTVSSADISNPLRRDTASVEAYGWLHIRLLADNPGAWAFHCHISWHTEAGLLMQFMTRTDLLADTMIPQANQDLCQSSLADLRKGAGPEDQVFFGSIG
jgi:FtsP/CotA-like multicopper oxidase with cupredoxin domain